eukprot:gene1989-33410_t
MSRICSSDSVVLDLGDSSFTEIVGFLDEAETHGKDIPTSFADGKGAHESRNVANEARVLKKTDLTEHYGTTLEPFGRQQVVCSTPETSLSTTALHLSPSGGNRLFAAPQRPHKHYGTTFEPFRGQQAVCSTPETSLSTTALHLSPLGGNRLFAAPQRPH